MKKENILNYQQIKEKIISLMKEIHPSSNKLRFLEIPRSDKGDFFDYFNLNSKPNRLFDITEFYDEFTDSRTGYCFSIKNEKNFDIASFNLTEMPSCCKYVVAQHFTGLSTIKYKPLVELMEFLAQLFGYTCVLYTNISGSNIFRVLENKNYQLLESSLNRRSENEVCLYFRELEEIPSYCYYDEDDDDEEIFEIEPETGDKF